MELDHHLQMKHNILFSKTTEKTKNRDNKLICKLLTEIINLLVKRMQPVLQHPPPPPPPQEDYCSRLNAHNSSFLIKDKGIIIFGN